MALISGVGSFSASGKVHDMEFENIGGLHIGGGEMVQVRGCLFTMVDETAITKTTGGPLEVSDCRFTHVGTAVQGESSGDLTYLTFVNNRVFGYVKVISGGVGDSSIIIANNWIDSATESDIAIELIGAEGVEIIGNRFLDPWGAVNADADSRQISIVDNTVHAYSGEVQACFHSEAEDTMIVGNLILGGSNSDDMPAITLDGVDGFLVADNVIRLADGHGIEIIDSLVGTVKGNVVLEPGGGGVNTYDGIIVTGGEQVSVIANQVEPYIGVPSTRYGINMVSGSNHAAYANYLGDSSEYGTADSADTATATQTSPAGGAIGGQFAF